MLFVVIICETHIKNRTQITNKHNNSHDIDKYLILNHQYNGHES
ncbi:hypothetical protein SAMN04488136_11577 [Vibrio xiamenensis]|uniref:Uncharacterized protein n=1 Tax=Vibrio xiamenensis TaxID=861298 RepID=A0A1G8C687_9VIBR|nr:hypothetical protein SAMN04488136_11577 [Vibrio xiamenensis]